MDNHCDEVPIVGAGPAGLTEETCVPGLHVAGAASRDVQPAIVAAAEGAKAGFAINKALLVASDWY